MDAVGEQGLKRKVVATDITRAAALKEVSAGRKRYVGD